MSRRRRTGAGIALNPDNIFLYWVIVSFLVAGVWVVGWLLVLLGLVVFQ